MKATSYKRPSESRIPRSQPDSEENFSKSNPTPMKEKNDRWQRRGAEAPGAAKMTLHRHNRKFRPESELPCTASTREKTSRPILVQLEKYETRAENPREL